MRDKPQRLQELKQKPNFRLQYRLKRSLTMLSGPLAMLLSLLIAAGSIQALPSDRRAPINVSADSATYKDSRGTYTGNVILTQGTLRIEADELTIIQTNRKVSAVIANGRPARFQQQARANGGKVHASARRIRYEVRDNQMTLTENAHITHKGSEIHSEKIVYNAERESVLAEGSKRAGERVNMTLQPGAADLSP